MTIRAINDVSFKLDFHAVEVVACSLSKSFYGDNFSRFFLFQSVHDMLEIWVLIGLMSRDVM